MKSRDLVFMSLLVGIGFILHTVVPGFFFGMKPDMMLVVMFLGIMLFPTVKHVLVLSITTGIIAALTTSFPAGQIPNIIDKPITAFLVLTLFLIFKKKQSVFTAGALTVIGTLISGTVFLYLALLIVGLPAPFTVLFTMVVLPATMINTLVTVFVYPVVKKFHK